MKSKTALKRCDLSRSRLDRGNDFFISQSSDSRLHKYFFPKGSRRCGTISRHLLAVLPPLLEVLSGNTKGGKNFVATSIKERLVTCIIIIVCGTRVGIAIEWNHKDWSMLGRSLVWLSIEFLKATRIQQLCIAVKLVLIAATQHRRCIVDIHYHLRVSARN